MTRPKDIPEDVWEMARELLGEPDDYQRAARPKAIERAARALMAYGQRRADEATERAAQICADASVTMTTAADFAHIFGADDNKAQVYELDSLLLDLITTAIRSQK